MNGPETDARGSAVDASPVVVGVGDVQGTSIFGGIVVAMANEGSLAVIVEVRVANRYPLTSVRHLGAVSDCSATRTFECTDIAQTIVVVFTMGGVRGEVYVIDPDVGRLLDANRITIFSHNFGAGNVTD